MLALEDVANPHNLGGMMRSCAHFGVKGVVVQDAALLESGAAIRTAEGGRSMSSRSLVKALLTYWMTFVRRVHRGDDVQRSRSGAL